MEIYLILKDFYLKVWGQDKYVFLRGFYLKVWRKVKDVFLQGISIFRSGVRARMFYFKGFLSLVLGSGQGCFTSRDFDL